MKLVVTSPSFTQSVKIDQTYISVRRVEIDLIRDQLILNDKLAPLPPSLKLIFLNQRKPTAKGSLIRLLSIHLLPLFHDMEIAQHKKRLSTSLFNASYSKRSHDAQKLEYQTVMRQRDDLTWRIIEVCNKYSGKRTKVPNHIRCMHEGNLKSLKRLNEKTDKMVLVQKAFLLDLRRLEIARLEIQSLKIDSELEPLTKSQVALQEQINRKSTLATNLPFKHPRLYAVKHDGLISEIGKLRLAIGKLSSEASAITRRKSIVRQKIAILSAPLL